MNLKGAVKGSLSSLILCFFIALLSPAISNAAEKTRVLTLDDLVQMALETSPKLRMAEQDILAAKSEYKEARGGQLPQIDILGTTGPTQDARFPTVNTKTGQIISNDASTWDIGIFGDLDAFLTQPIYTFGKISNREDAARYGVEASKAARTAQRNKIVLEVKKLYFAYLIAEQGRHAAGDASGYINDAANRIQRLLDLKSPNVNSSDLYRVQAYQGEVKAFAAKAESGARVAYAALKAEVGLPQDAQFQLKATELPQGATKLAPVELYIQRALSNRPELAEVKNGVAAKEKLAQAAQADLYPTIFAVVAASVAGAPGRQEFDNTYIYDQFNHSYADFFAGVNWHIDFGVGTGKRDKARAEYQKMLSEQDYARRNIPVEVEKYYEDAVEAGKASKDYQEAAVGARRWIVAAFSNFDLGIGTARDMFDAIDRYGKNQGNYLESLYKYNIALANLDCAVGEMSAKP
ncbi:MAG: TolC family protein [Syntrophobacteraceae bacterium]